MPHIVEFLEGTGKNASGLTHSDIIGLSDDELESQHDFIQWLFPLEDASECVPGSPVLTGKDVEVIRSSQRAQKSLKLALARMSSFYANNGHWLVPFDHNHRRITRILRSTRTLISSADEHELFTFFGLIMNRVMDASAPINDTSIEFWSNAVWD